MSIFDCSVEKAAEVAHEATMVNHGQCCVAGTRVFVQAPIYDQMVEKLKRLAEQRKVGDPFVSGTIQGPQVIGYCLVAVLCWYIITTDKFGTISHENFHLFLSAHCSESIKIA